ncbi:hypothetical protein [Cytobacillus firmus]|uniref:hypothetical protein n=1 Tax=Cytobacillus firmus TaxID=1399 RepID=UPI0018CE67AC|nr:hypothetical protein [Cytobacillus firmus]MED1906117.1 hypothetical protein [Cytobacillus firmus]MED1941532.1 hypothetical protein [Cytobacillus firmus]
MVSVVNEIESIGEFIEPVFASPTVHYQQVPVQPKENEMVIRYLLTDSATETSFSYRLNRTYQIIYFGKNEFDCLKAFEALEQQLNNSLVLPLKNSDRFLRLESFSYSQPFKTESGTCVAILGVLNAHLREAREQETYEKIKNMDLTVINLSI